MTFPWDSGGAQLLLLGGGPTPPPHADGTTREALAEGYSSFKFTVAIEGYRYLLTDAAPQLAIDAWFEKQATSHYTQALGGLFVDLQNEQKLEPYDPFTRGGKCVLYVARSTSADTFAVDVNKRSSNVENVLDASLDRINNDVTVKATSNFPSSGDAHVGTECFSYAAKTSTQFQGGIRGKYAPFTCDPAGTAAGVGFAEHHRVGNSAQLLNVKLNPVVSDGPRVWQGRWVAVYMHKFDQSIPALNSRDDALCVYAGRIASWAEDPATGTIVIELKHVLDVLAEATVGGRDQWEAQIKNVIKLNAGMVFRMKDTKIASGGTQSHKTANDLVVVPSGAAGANQINAGFYTAVEIFEAVNTWLASELNAGNLFGSYWLSFYAADDDHYHVRLIWIHPSTGSPIGGTYELGMPHPVLARFGFNPSKLDDIQTAFGPVKEAYITEAVQSVGSLHTHVAEEPYRRAILSVVGSFVDGAGAESPVEDEEGTFVDQYNFFPGSFKPISKQVGGVDKSWGIFLVDGHIMMSGYLDNGVLYRLQIIPEQFGLEGPDGYNDERYMLPLKVGQPETTSVRQIFVLEMPRGAAIKTFVKSTGTAGYNDATYDVLAYGLGAAIPHGIAGQAFADSVDALPGAGDSIAIVIDRPTKLADLLRGDFQITRSFFRWKAGSLEVSLWKSPVAGLSVATLDETNKAAPVGTQDNHRVVTKEESNWAIPTTVIRYNRAVNAGAEGKDSYRDTITLVDATAVDDAGGEGPTLIISARNTYGAYQMTGTGIEALAPGFLATMPFFSRPARMTARSIDQRYYEELAIGDVVLFTDRYARDPNTGQRAITARAATVVRNWYTPGGKRPGSNKAADQGGGVDLFVFDADRIAQYVPAAQIDHGAANGGYDAGTKTLTCHQHKYSEGTEAVDLSRFSNGDKVRILEIDPDDPASPKIWDDVINGAPSSTTCVLTTGLAGWDSARYYVMIFDDYGDALATQQSKTFQADDADQMVANLRAPFEYAHGTGHSKQFTHWAASDPVELPANAAHGDGVGRDTAHDVALARLINNLINYKTAHSCPWLSNNVLNPSGGTGHSGYKLVLCAPINFSEEVLLANAYRQLAVAPWFRSWNGSSASVRVTIARNAPTGTSMVGVSRGAVYSEATFTTTSTTWQTPTEQLLDLRVKDGWGSAWLLVEVTANAETRGLARCQETERVFT